MHTKIPDKRVFLTKSLEVGIKYAASIGLLIHELVDQPGEFRGARIPDRKDGGRRGKDREKRHSS